MFSRRNKIVLFITLLLFLSLACEFTRAEEDLPEVNSEDAIATSVAATIAANQVGEDPVESADPTVHPTVTASAPEPNFNYAGVSFYFNEALAENIVAGVNPAEIIDNTWWNTPEHREYRFTDWVLADSFLEARIKIYPVEGFLDVNPGVGGNIDALKLALTTKPTDGEGAPVVDIFNAARMYTSNVAYLQFQNGEGIRFLTQYGQAVSPLGWPMMFYTFQGITDDGRYLVSAMLPATHPSLPHPDQVTMDQAFMDNWETYVAETEALLNAEPDNSFLPPLALLDGMIESLMVGEP
jgi:hypothetical protein